MKIGWDVGLNKDSLDLVSGNLNMDNAVITYKDEKGNVISRETYNELRIKKLEDKISSLESDISYMFGELGSKANTDTSVYKVAAKAKYEMDELKKKY